MEKLVYFVDQNKKILMMFAAVFVAAAGAGGGYWLYQNVVVENPAEKYALRIGSHNIAQEDYQAAFEAAKQIQQIDESEFRSRYVPVQRELLAAEDLGVTVEQKAVDRQLETFLKQELDLTPKQEVWEQHTNNTWLQMLARQRAIQEASSQQASNKYQGSLFVFPFKRYITSSGSNFEKLGDEEAIEKDRRYAKRQAEEYHQQLKQGEISPKQLLKALSRDRRLSYMSSTAFGNKKTTWRDQVVLSEVSDFIETLNEAGVSSIQTGQVEVEYNEQGEVAARKPGYYYFVKLDSVNNTGLTTGELEEKASGYEVEWYE